TRLGLPWIDGGRVDAAAIVCEDRARRPKPPVQRTRIHGGVMAEPKTAQEREVVKFFETLSSGDLEALRAMLHADASWTPMVKPGIPGAGVHHPRDKIIDEFLAPVRGLFVPGDPKVHIDAIVSDGDR